MKLTVLSGIFFVAASASFANEKPAFRNGVLLQPDHATCVSEKKSSEHPSSNSSVSGASQDQARDLCSDYILQTDQLNFRIRSKNDKRANVLPAGQFAQFRLAKDKLLLRAYETSTKEIQFTVISITPRRDSPNAVNETADWIPPTR